MFLRRFAALGLLTAVMLAVVGCGSSSKSVTAAAYVNAVCKAVGPFEKDVSARSSALNPDSIKTPTQGKKALQGFLGAVSTDTDAALSALKSAGTPKVKNGSKIESAIVAAFAQLSKTMKTASSNANSLPTSDAKAFQAAATTLGTTVKNSMNGIGDSLSSLKSSQLASAAKNAPACKSLNA